MESELLHLDENEHVSYPRGQSPHSPKRLRESISPWSRDVQDIQYHADDDAGDENDEDLEKQVPKKQRRSSRGKPKAAARNAALGELKVKRASKTTQKFSKKESKIVTYGKKAPAKQKKKRSLPVNELVTVLQRLYESDVELANS